MGLPSIDLRNGPDRTADNAGEEEGGQALPAMAGIRPNDEKPNADRGTEPGRKPVGREVQHRQVSLQDNASYLALRLIAR